MFKEFIEQIMYALNRSVIRTTDNYGEGYEYGFKTAKDLVVKVIESYKPKTLDEPKSRGWWYFKASNSCSRLTGFYRIVISNGKLSVAHEDKTYTSDFDSFNGKWIKVEMPEEETKGDDIPYGYA